MKTKESKGPLNDPTAFRQQVRLAAVQVTGLGEEDLKVALAYEIEPFSGIPASEAELEFSPVADPDATVRVYDVAVRRRSARPTGDASLRRVLRWAYAAGILALALALADGVRLARTNASLADEVERRAALDARVQAVRRAAQTTRNAAADVRRAREATARAQNDAAAARAAFPQILAEVAQTCAARAVLKALASDGPATLRLSFVAPSVDAASETLVDLTTRAARCGWQLKSGPLSSNALGATVEFSCTLERKRP